MVLSSPHHCDEYDDAHHDRYHRAAVVVVTAVDVARFDDSLVTWQHPYCVMVLALLMSHWVEEYI
jgi:hypothetical protein